MRRRTTASRRLRLEPLVMLVLLALGACGAPATASPPGRAVTAAACPLPEEAAEDCPWAAIARRLRAAGARTDARGAIRAELAAAAPRLYADLAAARTVGGPDLRYVDLWGRSSNYDASQLTRPRPAPTVDEPVLDALNEVAGMPDARRGGLGSIAGAITFAGIEHTYGYLFSLLPTPFGFKRARWVRDDLEAGFGVARGTLGPEPSEGTLFANVTYLAGRVAFRGDADARERAALDAGAGAVARTLRGIDDAALTPLRVQETLALPGGRAVALRTDFVAFPARHRAPDGNTSLLVYSVRDSGDRRTRLITAFPVGDEMRAAATAPARRGEGRTITTQFNAFVGGVTDAAAPLVGAREVLACDRACGERMPEPPAPSARP